MILVFSLCGCSLLLRGLYHVSTKSEWRNFLHKLERILDLEDVDAIYDDYKMFPIHRMMTLVDGGVYVVRPTAGCALLRALCDESASERFPGHPFIEEMRRAKEDLSHMEQDWTLPLPAEPGSSEMMALYSRAYNEKQQDDQGEVALALKDRDMLARLSNLQDMASVIQLIQAASPHIVAVKPGEQGIRSEEGMAYPHVRLALLKLASLLTGNRANCAKFLSSKYIDIVLQMLESDQAKKDPYVCQYSLFIIAQFALCRPDYQVQVAGQRGFHVLITCIKDYWPGDDQVQLYAFQAMYACLRRHAALCCEHAAKVIDPIIESMKAYPAVARLNLFGLYILYEIALVADMRPLLCHPEVVKHVQAVQTRFYDDENMTFAAGNVLDLITKEVANVQEVLRLGIATGALS